MIQPNWNKFDLGFTEIVANYNNIIDKNNYRYIHPALKYSMQEVYVLICFEGQIDSIPKNFFKLDRLEKEGIAKGWVKMSNIAEFSYQINIQSINYGDRVFCKLDTSVKNIKVKGDENDNVGDTCVWKVDNNGQPFGITGQGVIIGIIDTGIEWAHENFIDSNLKTRILSVWDQELIPEENEKSPNLNLLDSSTNISYGVEYTENDINLALDSNNHRSIRHRDNKGHGTHVAGIAAGNGKMVDAIIENEKLKYAGVAPEASLIIVKAIGLYTEPKCFDERFKDAISYLFNKAANRPLVINCSFDDEIGPHDGYDKNMHEIINYINSKFNSIQLSETDFSRICVFSAGNEGNYKRHSKITLPSDKDEIIIELQFDDLRTFKKDDILVFLDFWYSNIDGISFGVVTPGAVIDPDSFLKVDVNPPENAKYSITHKRSTYSNISRNNCFIKLKTLKGGTYKIFIKREPGTDLEKQDVIIHLWMKSLDDEASPVGFKIIVNNPNLVNNNESTIGHLASAKNVITVGSYADKLNKMTSSSSIGPLVNHANPEINPEVKKPEICAPGYFIYSSRSRFDYNFEALVYNFEQILQIKNWPYLFKTGTSMAAPHVTGVIALMLENCPKMTREEILENLKQKAQSKPKKHDDSNMDSDEYESGMGIPNAIESIKLGCGN